MKQNCSSIDWYVSAQMSRAVRVRTRFLLAMEEDELGELRRLALCIIGGIQSSSTDCRRMLTLAALSPVFSIVSPLGQVRVIISEVAFSMIPEPKLIRRIKYITA
jgi:hypothetical protein